ncbi:MAG TPA: T9SS type A sorting domain-containing protein [Chitinophagales bacterium]|nr:T9SS type A sorting domain-containing protein [Chitinophagales bacterium]
MKKAITILIVCISVLAQADSWTQKAMFPGTGIDYPFSFSIGNKGYVGSGWDNTHTVTASLWEFNPASNVWTQKADFAGVARVGACAFTIGNKGYAGLGVDNSFSPLHDFWEYDPVTNTWIQKADFGGGDRYVAVGFSIGNKGYISTGISNYGGMNDLWQYDPAANTWTQKTSLPGAGRGDANCFVIDSNAYIAGGCLLAELWEYNSISDSWSQKATLPSDPRCDAAAFALCGKGYFGTGEFGGGNYGTDLWQYNPLTNAWIQKANFPGTGRDEPAGFAIGDKGYIGMGSQDGAAFFSDFWEYTPDSSCSAIIISNFSASDTTLCEKFCIDFFDSSQNNPSSWLWLFPGGSPSSSTDQNPSDICYTTPGIFDVTLITSGANGNDTLTLMNYITVYPTPPFPTITQAGYTLTSSPANSYQWQFNSIDIPGATNQSYTILQTGYYTVVIGDSNGCKNSLTQYVLISGINDVIGDANISVYPNPSYGNLIVELSNGLMAGEVSIDLVNTLGQKVFSSESRYIGTASYSEGAHSCKKEIDANSIAPGVYFLEINSNHFSVMRKIVIER